LEVVRCVKRRWTASVDRNTNLELRYVSKPLEFAESKNAIELESEAGVAGTIRKVRESTGPGELDEPKHSLADV
jgi:hypothetical protein